MGSWVKLNHLDGGRGNGCAIKVNNSGQVSGSHVVGRGIGDDREKSEKENRVRLTRVLAIL